METKKSERPDFLKLRAAAKDARELAQRLFRNDTTGTCWNIRQLERAGKEATGEHGCLERETKRLAGWPKLPSGSTLRGYSMIDPAKLCGSCLSYWYIEMGAQELERLVVSERHIAAEEKRELPRAEEPKNAVHEALRRTLPLLIKLGDFIGNDSDRCEVILAVREALGE